MQSKVDELMALADEYAFPTSVNTETGQVQASDMESARAALAAALEAALKECRNTTLDEVAKLCDEYNRYQYFASRYIAEEIRSMKS